MTPSRIAPWRGVAVARRAALGLALAATTALAAIPASAQAAKPPIKIGLLSTYSGPYADYGKQMDAGFSIWMKQHGDMLDGRKVEIIRKDETGAAPETVKRLARELVVNDQVNFLTGLTFTPNAFAAAPVATRSKTPTVVLNAAADSITDKSPFMVRTSYTETQTTAPLANWAAKNGIKKVYIAVSDYAPGYDAEKAFRLTFTKDGGTIVGAVRIPLHNPDFSPYVSRIRDAHPQAVFTFMPSGELPVAFVRSFNELGLAKAGVILMSTGGSAEDKVINLLGSQALGTVTSIHYFPALDNKLNHAYVADYKALMGKNAEPDFYSVDSYDGLGLIYHTVEKLHGNISNPMAVMAAMRGTTFQSPRGPVHIDAKNGDLWQNVYIRKVEMVDGKLDNKLIETVPMVDDHGVSHP